MSKRTTAHATFVIERDYPHPPAKVFAAYANPEKKRQWFGGPAEWESTHEMDFSIGGRETSVGGPPGGTVHKFDGEYWDIVENERIVFGYEMHLDATRISVSLGSTELQPTARGTRLTYTEQGIYLDGYDDAGSREHGTGELLNNLGRFLDREAQP